MRDHPSPTTAKLLLAREARHRRNFPSAAASRLWSALRERQLLNQRFRRAAPVHGQLVDFWCPDAALAICLDHVNPDLEETFHDKGVRLLIIPSALVFSNLESVLFGIATHLPGRGYSRARCT